MIISEDNQCDQPSINAETLGLEDKIRPRNMAKNDHVEISSDVGIAMPLKVMLPMS